MSAAPRAPRARLALLAAGSFALAVGLSACATTEQESARIGRESQVAAAQANAPAHPAKHSHHSAGHHTSKRSAG